jgi:hypothetical protein
MISLTLPNAPARLKIRRVRRVAPFIFLVMPVGWLMLLIADDFHRPLGMAGLGIYILGFLASLLVIPTGVQRIAGGLPQGLDEMQLTARFKAQSEAYRWFSLWILCMAVAMALIHPVTGLVVSSEKPAITVFFLWVIAWSVALPAFFLARAIPIDEDFDGNA